MIPPQFPEVPPRYRFRPRNDVYRIPQFRAPMTPRVTEPYERFPDNEPRSSIELRDLADPVLLVAAVMTLLGGGALLVFVFTS